MLATMDSSLVSPTIFPVRRPVQKKKMSITQTYYLAHTARSKLSKEAARADHDLRVLVGHANLLDSLMLDLSNAEKEQEQWFNNTVRDTTKKAPVTHIRWADTIEEESMEDYDDDDSDVSDDDYSDYDEEEEEEEEEETQFEDLTIPTPTAKPARRAPSPPALFSMEDVLEEEEDDDEEEAARLTLTRAPSRQQSPPELLDDLSSDEDEDSMPPSPKDLAMDAFTPPPQQQEQKHPAKRADMLSDAETQSMFEEHGFIHHQGTMIPAY